MTHGAPEGFSVERVPGRFLMARTEHLPDLLRAGLLEPRTWDDACAAGGTGGRGPTGRLRVDANLVLRVKRMRRGGIARHLWRDRFLRTGRLVANLTGPKTALERGVPTVEPIALLVERSFLALHRSWLATRDAPDATSLAERLRSVEPPTVEELRAAVDAVRLMHDRGIDHRDLNLGNVLLQKGAAAPAPLVIDLDRSSVESSPVSALRRSRAIRRLERSTVKLLGPTPRCAGVDLRRFWYEEYARARPALARTLDRARRANEWAIALHRLAWRR